jgi:hypothetical protein
MFLRVALVTCLVNLRVYEFLRFILLAALRTCCRSLALLAGTALAAVDLFLPAVHSHVGPHPRYHAHSPPILGSWPVALDSVVFLPCVRPATSTPSQ